MNELLRKSLSDQLESICRFPALIQKYPQASAIGTQTCMFLIADIFVKGTNTHRAAIAAMFRRCHIRHFPALDECWVLICCFTYQK